MQTVTRKAIDKKTKSKEKLKDDLDSKSAEEKPKKSIYSVSTPRNYPQKSSTADIYSKRNSNIQSAKTPKKPHGVPHKRSNESPMKDVLKSSPSINQLSAKSSKNVHSNLNIKSSEKSREKSTTSRNKLPINVTVNSPIAKRKLNLERELTKDLIEVNIDKNKKLKEVKNNEVVTTQRQRTKTRTLEDDEVKVLTADVIDNNAEMINLTKKLSAQPKAFYVNLNDEPKSELTKCEDEVSYEDDFESYESDFESYKSSHSDTSSTKTDSEKNDKMDKRDADPILSDDITKEERMLDSGHFDLRGPHSANQIKPMDFILEASQEGDKKISLTDEGFQEMSSSSGFSSMKTSHTEVLERPLFIDFTKSNAARRKRRIFERLKQRASDILSMVTLHEMSYNLFEMQPIPYDLYMATFGRLNYTQIAVQTFDDGVNNDTQTDVAEFSNKWTQHPVDFSKNSVCLNLEKNIKDDFLNEEQSNMTFSEEYKNNPLRIYFEQKNGAGSDQLMPYDNYKLKIENNRYNISKLRRFLKRVESKISNILSVNAGNTEMSNVVKSSKFSFSDGYISLNKNCFSEKYSYLKHLKIIRAVFSETKSNLIITIHEKSPSGVLAQKCVLCLWNLSVAILQPLKVLIATDDVKFGLYHGNIDGIFVGALCDGSIHVWDLSEEAMWCSNDTSDTKPTEMVEIDSTKLTATEKDREWNLKNRDVLYQQERATALQACAYTNSAYNIIKNETIDSIVGMEFIGNTTTVNMDSGKIVGQICVLHQIGILTIWSIIQEKLKSLIPDIGKTAWSRLKLEKNQTINLSDYVYESITDPEIKFSMTAAKKRLATKRTEKNNLKMERQSSSFETEDRSLSFLSRSSSINKNERPVSAASSKKSRILVENIFDNTAIYYCLKVLILNRTVNFLVAKNCGEVMRCTKIGNTIKVDIINVASKASSVTSLEVSPHGLPYFLAATDCGSIHMCSVIDSRVLLTLDCRNVPSSVSEKYHGDSKGRFAGSYEENTVKDNPNTMLKINSIIWSYGDPFSIIALLPKNALGVWELTHSDIHAKSLKENVAVACGTSDRALALITPDNEVHIYKLLDQQSRLDLFQKYISLL